MSRHLRGKTYFVLGINAEKMSGFLRLRHRENWPSVKGGILSVETRLKEGAGGRVALSGEDLSILGDVSDALDSKCESLFKEMRERRTSAAQGVRHHLVDRRGRAAEGRNDSKAVACGA